MKFTRHHFMLLLAVALVPLAAFSVITGHPVTDFLPHDLVAALGLAGMGMAGTFKNYALNVNPVRPNAKIVITLGAGDPNAPTLDALILTLTGAAFDVSKINSITGIANGRRVYNEAGGTVHNARRAYLGQPIDVKKLVIDLIEPNARSGMEQNLSAWPLSLMTNARFELAIDATAGADMGIQVQQVFRAPTANPNIKKFNTVTQHFAAGGKHTIMVPSGQQEGGKLMRVWIRESVAGNVTAAELRSKNAIGIEGTRAEIQDRQKDWGLVPQAGVFCLDFIEDGNLAGWFDTTPLGQTVLNMTGTAACTYDVDFEYLDPIGRL